MWLETVRHKLLSALHTPPTNGSSHTCEKVVDGTLPVLRTQHIRAQVQARERELNLCVNLVTVVPSNAASVSTSLWRGRGDWSYSV